jgi:ComF family protein
MMADSAFQSSAFFDETEMFVPVPLHWIRRLVRGFNQSRLICKKIKHPSAKINTDLVRIRNTHRQWDLNHAKRKRNVAGAFAVRKGHNFTGKRICLVDDITTSWATLNECAKTLKQAGAEKVYAIVAAVAAQPKK